MDRGFRFGFIVADEARSLATGEISHWRRFLVGGLVGFAHPETKVQSFEGSGWQAVVLGDMYVAHGARSVPDLICMLADREDYSALDQLGGRFALVICRGGGIRFYHDAFGSRSLYYRGGPGLLVGSHASLVAQVCGETLDPAAVTYRDSPEYKQRGTSYLPGDRTMYRGIFALTPNHYYSAERSEPVRFWPRGDVEASDFDSFAEVADEYFRTFSAFLRDRGVGLFGLTGGVDGRVLLAGVRAYDVPHRLVTWGGGRLPPDELPVVKRMVRHLGSSHQFMDVGRRTEEAKNSSLMDATEIATGFSRGKSALTANMSRVADERDVFVRGYGGEILRGFYNRHNRELPDRSPDALTDIYLTRRVGKPTPEFRGFAVRAFAEFIERTDFQADFFNHDPLDIFYWEQRMGTWGSMMLNEMDPVVYSMAGMNSRRLFEAAFGLEREERLGMNLLLRLTRRYDAEFAGMGAVS